MDIIKSVFGLVKSMALKLEAIQITSTPVTLPDF